MVRLFTTDIHFDTANEMVSVPIVADGLIATGTIGDGRLLPVVILDCRTRPDIHRLVEGHKHFASGDVRSNWFRRSRWTFDALSLHFQFTSPIRCAVVVEFPPNRVVLEDQIIRTQGFYLVPGEPGDKVSTKFSSPRILIETPSEHVREDWEELFFRVTVKRLRKDGLSKGKAKEKARYLITEWRSLGEKRMPG